MEGFSVDLDAVQTNMCYIELTDGRTGPGMVAALAERGVDLLDLGPTLLRAVTHLHVDDDDIEHAITAFADL